MKLASFHVDGRQGHGIVAGDGVIDIARHGGERFASFADLLEADALAEIRRHAGRSADFALSAVRLALPVDIGSKIICVGRNYRGHVAEANARLPEHPSVFIRLRESFSAPGGDLVRPTLSADFDYEGELALVIGTGGRHIAEEAALRHVAGYTCLNDGSIRDFQFGHSLIVGKNFFRTGSIGPWVTTGDELGDPAALELRTRLNGQEVQHTRTDDLIFDIPFLISYISSFIPLSPGDIIATGTPEGVGFARKPPLWMKPGDVIEVEISGIGILRNTVVAE